MTTYGKKKATLINLFLIKKVVLVSSNRNNNKTKFVAFLNIKYRYVEIEQIIKPVEDNGLTLLGISMPKSAIALNKDNNTKAMNNLFALPLVIFLE